MTHKFKDEITDWLNGGVYEHKQHGWTKFYKIVQLQDFNIADEVRKVDEYRHLREALERGETIQFCDRGLWEDIKYPAFNARLENYRIKPKTKKMVQWLFKSEVNGNFYVTQRYFDIGIKPEVSHGTPIKPLPHTEIEVDCE